MVLTSHDALGNTVDRRGSKPYKLTGGGESRVGNFGSMPALARTRCLKMMWVSSSPAESRASTE